MVSPIIVLATAAVSLNQRPALVLVLNRAYLPVFDNFIRAPAIPSLSQWDVYLLCVDGGNELMLKVVQMGWRCTHVTQSSNSHRVQDVYTGRIPYVKKLISGGRDVLISDLDALWLKDPLPEIKCVAARAGIISSRGLSPSRSIKLFGTAVCMGFVFFKGSDCLVREAFAALTNPMREDQSSFNENLLREGVEWDEQRLSMDATSTSTTYGRILAPGRSYANLSIAMLSHNRFIRNCNSLERPENATIAHCFSGHKLAETKRTFLSARKLWWVDTDAPNSVDQTRLRHPLPVPLPA